ncbi:MULTISPECIES: GntR family transcriptional regulator [Streptomyces]|uniref:GntR family transcriptional regulator n=1 Tax=Streptomyces morookaense TaxID=1970 RepID=A0A7Y7E832_STRMO|nr:MULTISPECIES: GntR family transcriptional regulator [Streptomyces]MCC2278338.1 GntR family transcriptional regulator [Streptomyces sp. ET3-23]NVK79019.1 GntR family transcriptional regulator [Streptomyces morookaense]
MAAYLQIVQQVQEALRLGILTEGDQLPTAARVARDTRLNPNTTLKAYRELEHLGLVEPRPGVGTFVSSSAGRPNPLVESPLRGELSEWMRRARAAGLDWADVSALITVARAEHYPAG